MYRTVGIILVACIVIPPAVFADVTPSSMFGNHMVLQRNMPVPVWGKADPHEAVTVRFGGHEATTTANKSGRWKVELPLLQASSTGRDMVVEGKNTVVFKDVLVGEVWICSGQSNMQYGWGKTSPFTMYNWGGDETLATLVQDARQKPIRCFHVDVDVSFSPNDNCKGQWWPDVSGSAVAFGFSYYLYESLQVPVAVIVTSWGSSFIEGWMPLDMTEQLPHFKTMIEELWTLPSVTRVNNAITMGVRPGFVWLRKRPNLLYNAMLHPIIPYACRGVVWYQGEANANDPQQYGETLPLWIERLREGWGREDLHVHLVMLPGYGRDDGRPDGTSWAWFREAQMNALSLPHTSVVNTIDLGDAKNIHPSDKAPICRRLALLTRHDVHGERVTAQGPTYKKSAIDGKRMIIHFEYAAGLKTNNDDDPNEFWLAGEDRVWHPATAVIEGQRVAVSADDVEVPVSCRYAWCGKPDVNLVNGANLPTHPFRTDDWPQSFGSGNLSGK